MPDDKPPQKIRFDLPKPVIERLEEYVLKDEETLEHWCHKTLRTIAESQAPSVLRLAAGKVNHAGSIASPLEIKDADVHWDGFTWDGDVGEGGIEVSLHYLLKHGLSEAFAFLDAYQHAIGMAALQDWHDFKSALIAMLTDSAIDAVTKAEAKEGEKIEGDLYPKPKKTEAV